MEEVFYNLTGQPFRLSPDHRFCYDHKCYAKARAYMTYAFRRAEGFVMITGRPGTGKTTLIGELIESLSDENVVTANLVCTQLHADDLLKVTAYDFGVDHRIVEKGELLQHLGILLKRWYREGRRALLIVDEAQDLSESAMEELRLLTNIQENGSPLLQIFLLGQPELRDLVLSPSMEQVHQRVVAASHLEALKIEETEAYIIHRLKKVGWQNDPALSKTIFPLIHKFSEGVPRRINLICSRLFLHGCVEQRHQIGVADLREVIQELQAENLAAGTRFSDEDFELEDNFDNICEAQHAEAEDNAGLSGPPDITIPENSEPIAQTSKEYLHAVGDEVVLQFDSATGNPIPDSEKKKDDVIALQTASSNSEDTENSTQSKPTTSPAAIAEAAAKAPLSSQAASSDSGKPFSPPAEPHASPVAGEPSAELETAVAAKPETRAVPAPTPRHRFGSTMTLSTMALVALLLLGWLAIDRNLTTAQAWQNQFGNWWQSSGAADYFKISKTQPGGHHKNATSPSSAIEPEPLPEKNLVTPETETGALFQPEAAVEPGLDTQLKALPDPLPEPKYLEPPGDQVDPGQEPEPESIDRFQAMQPSAEIEALPSSTQAAKPLKQMNSEGPPSSVKIVFAFDSAALSETAQATLDDVAAIFNETGSGQMRVTGYSDRVGDPGYNLTLSRRRANTVAQYLIASGVRPGALSATGLGIYQQADSTSVETVENTESGGRIVHVEVRIDQPW